MQHQSHIRNHTQQILLIARIGLQCLLVTGCKKHLGSGTLTADLLLLVVGILQELAILHKDNLVKLRQIGRVETNRVLHQQDSLHATFQDVALGIELILHQLDDRDQQVSITVPAEDIVDGVTLLLVNLTIDLLRERCKQHHRQVRVQLFHLTGEVEYVGLAHVVHRKHKVEVVTHRQQRQRIAR